MGLVSRSGSSTQSSAAQQLIDAIGTANVPLNQPGVTAGDNQVKSSTDALQNLPEIRDPALDRLTFDTSQYIQTLNSIQGYSKGTRVTTVYFQQLNENWNRRSNTVDPATMRNSITAAYRRINGFEITIPEPWDFSYDQSQGGSELKGTAVLYPGMNPKVGDIFYANVGDGNLGEFKVSSIRPTTWRTRRAYEISYFLYNFPSSIDVFPQQDATVQEVNFVKGNYLGDTAALLTPVQADALDSLAAQRTVLARMYYRDFFDPALNSFVVPHSGKAYDPFLVKFANLMMTFNVVKKRAVQLFPAVDDPYENTVWAALNDKLTTDLGMVIPFYRLCTYKIPNMGVGATTLTNRAYLMVDGTAYTDYQSWLASQPAVTPPTTPTTGNAGSGTGSATTTTPTTPATTGGSSTGSTTTSGTTPSTSGPTTTGSSTSTTTVVQPTDDMDIGEFPTTTTPTTGGAGASTTGGSTSGSGTSTSGSSAGTTTTTTVAVSSELDLSPDPSGPTYLAPCDPIQGGVYETITPVVQDITIPATGYYAFSEDFYEGNLPGMTPLERVLTTVIQDRSYTDTASVLSLISAIKVATPLEKFYGIPALLKIIDITASSVGNGAAM